MERGYEIGSLLVKKGETEAVFVAMFPRRIVAFGLFRRMEELQREDGKAVEHHARGLGVEGRYGGDGFEVMEQPLVDLFDEIVAALIVSIDGALYGGNLRVGRGWVTGFVFFVPEIEVGAVFLPHEALERARIRRRITRIWAVPLGGPQTLCRGEVLNLLPLPCVGH